MSDVVRYCVVQHSTGPSGGFVVRTSRDGWLPQPYTYSEPLRVYVQRAAAQAFADKVNRGEQA